MTSERPVLADDTGRRGRLGCEIASSIPDVAGYINIITTDAGALGIVAEVERLPDIDAFYQFEALRAAPPVLQALACVRMAALRSRLFGVKGRQ